MKARQQHKLELQTLNSTLSASMDQRYKDQAAKYHGILQRLVSSKPFVLFASREQELICAYPKPQHAEKMQLKKDLQAARRAA